MRLSVLFILFFFCSCHFVLKKHTLTNSIVGKWLVVYPDEQLENRKQHTIYARIQDSIVNLKGLKLINISDDGSFYQADTMNSNGRWKITEDNKLHISKGGTGFENFNTVFLSYEDGVLQLVEYIKVENELIRLVWHLKKINKTNQAAGLLETKENEWRNKPLQAESGKEIQTRLSAMLHYHAVYYAMLAKESSYFIPGRIILPFMFYQHAMGLKKFNPDSRFAALFFNQDQAETAWHFLEQTLYNLKNKFPSEKNYVEEYSLFMQAMAEEVVRVK